MICTIIYDDGDVYTVLDVKDEEIPAMLDSGFVAGVVRPSEYGIEYAEVNWEKYTIEWTKPEVRSCA